MSNLTDATDAALTAERASSAAMIAADADTIRLLQGQRTSDAQQIADLQARVADDQAQAAILLARIAELEEGQPSPATLIGASCGSDDGGLDVTADIRRTYNAGALPADFGADGSSRDASARTRPGGVVWTSYHGGVSETSLRAALKSMSTYLTAKSQTGLVTFEHEPDIKGAIPPSVYHAGYDQLERVIAEFPNLQPIVCLTGYTGDRDPAVWETYSRPGHKMIGADHYNRGHQQTGKPLLTPAENYGKLVAFAKGKGKPLCIGETGARTETVPGPVIKTRADWYKAHRAYVLDPANGIASACAFDSGLGLLDAASAHAWYAL